MRDNASSCHCHNRENREAFHRSISGLTLPGLHPVVRLGQSDERPAVELPQGRHDTLPSLVRGPRASLLKLTTELGDDATTIAPREKLRGPLVDTVVMTPGVRLPVEEDDVIAVRRGARGETQLAGEMRKSLDTHPSASHRHEPSDGGPRPGMRR